MRLQACGRSPAIRRAGLQRFKLAWVIIGTALVIDWNHRGFGSLADEHLAVLSATLIIVGTEMFFGSFLVSTFGLRFLGGA
jgi:hypothetical protein